MGLSIRGSGARVHVNVTSSMLDSGSLEFEGDFGASSQILVAGSTVFSTLSRAIAFLDFLFDASSTLLLLDNYFEGSGYAVYFSTGVVDGGGIIVKGNTLSTTEEDDGMESAVYVYAVVRNGGYFDVENNTMRSVSGIYLYGGMTVSSAGLLRVADCNFVGSTEFADSALVYLDSSVTLQGGAQWRVEGNSVSTASVLSITDAQQKIELSGSGTTVVLANNRQVDDSFSFADLDQLNMVVASPAKLVVGCNVQDDEEASYDDVFPEDVVFGCGTVQRRRGVL
ncbi:dispersed gene family protein 1 (DGF-1), putative, partial [Trypanosoma cruzi marinkellei]